VGGAEVEDAVNRIQPQCIDVILSHPVQCIADDVMPHMIAVRSIIVDRQPPGSPVTIREIGAKLTEIIPLRPEMVVDDVQNYRESGCMAGIYEPLQSVRPPIS